MLESTPTAGSIDATDAMKRALAAASLETNCRDRNFVSLFPNLVELQKKRGSEPIHQQPSLSSSSADQLPSSINPSPQTQTKVAPARMDSVIVVVLVLLALFALSSVFGGK